MLAITVIVLLSLGLSLAGDYKDLKCWRNKIPQQVDRLEGTHEVLDKQNYKKRADAISKCHVAAQDGGYDFFSVGNKGQCWAGHGVEYQKYGRVDKCPENGKGLYGIMNVYEMANEPTTKSPEAHGEYCDGEYCSVNEQCVGSWWRGKSCQPLELTTGMWSGEFCEGEYCSADEQCVGNWWGGKSCQHGGLVPTTQELELTTEMSHGEYCDGVHCAVNEQCVGSWWRGKSCQPLTTQGPTTEIPYRPTTEAPRELTREWCEGVLCAPDEECAGTWINRDHKIGTCQRRDPYRYGDGGPDGRF